LTLVSPSFLSSCKIGDFGKARRIPQGVSSLALADEDALAVNWLAPEVLQRRLFFVESETWSFAVAIWELFAHGAVPYGRLYAVRR
jgi:tyrosine-protein kinase